MEQAERCVRGPPPQGLIELLGPTHTIDDDEGQVARAMHREDLAGERVGAGVLLRDRLLRGEQPLACQESTAQGWVLAVGGLEAQVRERPSAQVDGRQAARRQGRAHP